MLLEASGLPNWIKAGTDRESNDSNRAMSKSVNDELQRVVLRNANEAPRWKKSTVESDGPKRAMLLKVTERPIWTESITENKEP